MIDKLLRILENKENALDAVALVPGPNFRHITGGQFFLMERPFVIFISKFHKPVAVVPVLEVSNFTKLNFDADIIEWQDNDGFQHAFDKALKKLGDNFALGIEGQLMRAF
ncbi:MAG: aminopeptidase P family N-terminal domain-containing protein, partial [Alphaproteobacteria bacterium]